MNLKDLRKIHNSGYFYSKLKSIDYICTHKKQKTMKKTFLILSASSIVIGLNAQTLNQNTHAPAVGDVYTFQYADPATLPANLGNPGPGSNFNFSSLTIYSGSQTSQGVTVASTGSASAYPNANVAVKTGTDNVFYDSQNSYLDFYGGSMTLGGYPVTLNYSTPTKLGIYPMSLGTTGSGTVAGTIFVMGNNGNFVGTSSFTANATGTLTVPGGITYPNVIRVQTQQNMTFTVSFIQGTLTVNQYDYYAPSYSNFPNVNNNWPVLTVQQSTITSNIGGTSIQTTVTINGNYQTLGIKESSSPISDNISVSPNPVKDYAQITAPNFPDIKNVSILDITGKVLKNNINVTQPIDCTNLSNGTYFIQAEDKNGKIITEKIIVQH
ncbi:MAG: T9SS C-terminal target domain-containing protein [Bacteroidetes bacterium]|nr:MAG: T9SS C-terminal target domain-containing protein [Bacteroidota bacterium]